MLKKPWFLFVLFIGWCWLCLQWYCCWMQVACPGCTNEMQNPYAIGFKQNVSEPYFGTAIDQLNWAIFEQPDESLQLEITGKYFLNEKDGQHLAVKRAEALAAELRKNYASDGEIKLRTQKVWENAPGTDSFFQAIDIQWVDAEIPEIPLHRTFYFDKAITATGIEANDQQYLRSLAQLVNKSGQNILVEGHADNSGSPAVNAQLALERANFIASRLGEFGVVQGQIIIENKKDAEPLVPNTTEENRAKNRRVVLKVLD